MRHDTTKLDVHAATQLLRNHRLRRTIARTRLLQCLSNQAAPRTQAEIGELLSSEGFDSSTIFRGLTALTEAGLVVRIDAGDRVSRFELHDRGPDGQIAARHHPHVTCQICGRVACLSLQDLGQLPAFLGDWKIADCILRGACGDCSNNSSGD